jgi:hydroxyacylglutathione hydrolase
MKLRSYTGGIAETNGWVLELDSGVLVIDAPLGMAEWLEQEGITPAAVFLTHQHFDHVQSAADMAERWGCPLYAWAALSPELTLEILGGRDNPMFHVRPYEVTHLLAGQSSLLLLGTQWQLAHVPGHSLDSLTLYHPELGLLFGGDVLFAGGIGRTDFPGGSLKMLLEGIANKLLCLPDATQVMPGHGPTTTIGEERAANPYLNE